MLQLSIISLVNGIFFVFSDLAGASILPRLVEPAQLPTATSLSMITDGVPNLLGAPLGGLLYSMGRALPFVADAFSYVVSVCSLLAVTSSFQEEREKASRSLLHEMLQGLRWLWHKPDVASLAVVPDSLQGRVTSVYHLVALGTEPVGLALTGVLIQRFGVVPTILLQTGGLLILALTITLNPHVRKMRLPSRSVD